MCWHRKEELAIGFTTPAGAQALLDKYRSVDVEHNMLKYVVEGRAAMGPSFLKVCCGAAPNWVPWAYSTTLIVVLRLYRPQLGSFMSLCRSSRTTRRLACITLTIRR